MDLHTLGPRGCEEPCPITDVGSSRVTSLAYVSSEVCTPLAVESWLDLACPPVMGADGSGSLGCMALCRSASCGTAALHPCQRPVQKPAAARPCSEAAELCIRPPSATPMLQGKQTEMAV